MSAAGGGGRVVLVTGGTRGIGRAIAEAFLAQGDAVVVCGRKAPEALPEGGGASAEYAEADVRDAASAERLVAGVVERHGRLDVLVNNAGGSPYALVADASPRFLSAIIELNLTAPLLMARLAHAAMAATGGGVVINIASVSGTRASPGTAAYGAAKAGLLNATRSLAVEWAPAVRVVAVTVGMVETEAARAHYGGAEGIARVAATVPAGRMATPADVARACVFLAGPDASYVTGASLLLDGGGERPAFLDAASEHER
ncbi:MAG: SDR family oxidoreductase [Deltaproteobacteria bacterium]|nr:SDR family oxidoreductase [Deltaproteobacteria bacterium]